MCWRIRCARMPLAWTPLSSRRSGAAPHSARCDNTVCRLEHIGTPLCDAMHIFISQNTAALCACGAGSRHCRSSSTPVCACHHGILACSPSWTIPRRSCKSGSRGTPDRTRLLPTSCAASTIAPTPLSSPATSTSSTRGPHCPASRVRATVTDAGHTSCPCRTIAAVPIHLQ